MSDENAFRACVPLDKSGGSAENVYAVYKNEISEKDGHLEHRQRGMISFKHSDKLTCSL